MAFCLESCICLLVVLGFQPKDCSEKQVFRSQDHWCHQMRHCICDIFFCERKLQLHLFIRLCLSRWWFQRLFIFTHIWGRFPIWLIFFNSGWNHQLDIIHVFCPIYWFDRSTYLTYLFNLYESILLSISPSRHGCFQKIGKHPKVDGENNRKPYY